MRSENPFSRPSAFSSHQPPRRPLPPKKERKLPVLLGVVAGALVVAALVWITGPAIGASNGFRNLLTFNVANEALFVPQGEFRTAEAARERFRMSAKAEGEGQYEAALVGFKSLESVYPAFSDLLKLHEADIYAAQGNEWAAQKKLAEIDKIADSPLRAVAAYRMGQSQFRGSEWEKAQAQFERVRQDYPGTPYATGSLYYLAQLALKKETPDAQAQAVGYAFDYLEQCPKCRFSGELAEKAAKLALAPTPEQEALIGKGLVYGGRDWKGALTHLEKAPFRLVWFDLAKARKQTGQVPLAVRHYIDGLQYARDTDEVRAAVDSAIANTPAAERLARLKAMAEKSRPVGGDYLWWKLAELDAPNAQSYYQALVSRYPSGDYAPESAWRLLWPLLKTGQREAFLARAQAYLDRYAYAKAAPKVLFWIAKSLEATNPAEATRAYERVLTQYPTTYYAFRANGRLNVLARGQRDPGWETDTARLNYPPQGRNLMALDILPPWQKFASDETLGKRRRDVATELRAIGAGDDMELYLTETMGTLPPALESWILHVRGERPKAIRVIRDAVENSTNPNRKKTDASGKAIADYEPAKDDLKLLYPIYFEDAIARFAPRNRLDPYLVQSLMREESYFNEMAVSGSNALGLMQLLPSTAGEVAGWEGLGGFQSNQLFTPAVNVQLGTRYLGYLHTTFGGDSMRAVGSYNGGPNAMKRWVAASPTFATDRDMFVESIPYEQTRDYIKKVFGAYWNYQRLYAGQQ